MIRQFSGEEGLAHGAAHLLECRFATFILDRMGRIVSCGEPGERIFAESSSRMIGRSIAEFIDGLCLGGTSASYNARYLDHLCAELAWRRFSARDVTGQRFFVELNLVAIVADGQRLFLLNLRCPTQADDSLTQPAEAMSFHG